MLFSVNLFTGVPTPDKELKWKAFIAYKNKIPSSQKFPHLESNNKSPGTESCSMSTKSSLKTCLKTLIKYFVLWQNIWKCLRQIASKFNLGQLNAYKLMFAIELSMEKKDVKLFGRLGFSIFVGNKTIWF